MFVLVDQNGHKVTRNYKQNIQYLKDELGVGKSFDVLATELRYAGRDMTLFMIDGLIDDRQVHLLMKFLAKLKPGDLDVDPLTKLMKTDLTYADISTDDNLDKAVFWVTCGAVVLIVDGISQAIIIDARQYPTRSPAEPDVERVIRGARDGFVETMVFNTALTRRRVRDPSLRMVYMSVGRRSKTDVCVAYIEDIANPDVVKRIKDSISKIDVDGLPMGEKTLEEFIGGRHFNPFPFVRYTERPDTAAVHLLEGHVLVFVDGSPVVLIMPSTFWNQLQHVEEYRQKPIVGSYLRLVRYFAVWASIFLLPLWYIFTTHPDMLPTPYNFITLNKTPEVPIVVQLISIEIGMDAVRMATIHTPSALATALGLVATLMIGQIAVSVGLYSPELILYMAVAAIGTFATPLYELSLANRLMRVMLILFSFFFGVPGYTIGSTLALIFMTRMRSFQIPYLWPFIPFNFREMADILFRVPIPLKSHRPPILLTKDPDK